MLEFLKKIYSREDNSRTKANSRLLRWMRRGWKDLANSIRVHGVLQPLLVRKAEEGFELIAGERRWRAARRAGLSTVPVIVEEIEEKVNWK